MAEAGKPVMRKPVYTKVEQLRPGTTGHTLVVKVLSSKLIMQKGRPDGPQIRQMRIAECLVGDETGIIVFTARNEQGEFQMALCFLKKNGLCVCIDKSKKGMNLYILDFKHQSYEYEFLFRLLFNR